MYDDVPNNAWELGGGAMGLAAIAGGATGGCLGKRKRAKNAPPKPVRVKSRRARAAAVRTARVIRARQRQEAPVTVADGIPPAIAAAAEAPAVSSGPGSFDAIFNAAVDADNAAGAEIAPAASAGDPAAADEVPPDYFGGDGGGDVVGGVDGLGKSFFSKIGKAVSKLAPVALPVGAALIGGPLAAAAAGAISNTSAKVASANTPITVKDQFGNLLSRIGDVLLDSAGRGVAQLVGGQWVSNPSINPPTFNGGSSGNAPASSGQNLTPWLIGGAALVAVIVLSRK
jgi:hypothetical protein